MIINSAKYSCAAGHEINEDSCLCSAEKGIFIVADGLGGHSDGEKASLAAVDYFEENYCGNCSNELISQLMEGANTEVLQKGDGGKTTVAAAFAENGNFHYANAGDSRVYYFRDGRIIAQTKDHSVCQASVDMGMIRPEDIRGNEDRSRLLKVLGSEERLNIKKYYAPIRIQNGDAFLICSDGFWEYVYEDEMEADLLKSENPEVWLKYMLKRHILRAENKGDNYTAICGMIYLDGSESFELPAADQTVQDVPDKSRLHGLVPIIIAGTAVIAAAIVLSIFLHSGNDRETVPEITETSSVSETTVTETETTTKTTNENEDGSDVTTPADNNVKTPEDDDVTPPDDDDVTPPADEDNDENDSEDDGDNGDDNNGDENDNDDDNGDNDDGNGDNDDGNGDNDSNDGDNGDNDSNDGGNGDNDSNDGNNDNGDGNNDNGDGNNDNGDGNNDNGDGNNDNGDGNNDNGDGNNDNGDGNNDGNNDGGFRNV